MLIVTYAKNSLFTASFFDIMIKIRFPIITLLCIVPPNVLGLQKLQKFLLQILIILT